MRVWLDDLRDPKDPFIQERYGAEPDMVWVKTAYEALVLLNRHKNEVEFISFDHDLGHDIENGDTVARWIEQEAWLEILPPIKWAVHSDNPVGAARIRTAMQNADKYWAKSV